MKLCQRLLRMLRPDPALVDSRARDLRIQGIRHMRAVRRLSRVAPSDPFLAAEYQRAEEALRHVKQ